MFEDSAPLGQAVDRFPNREMVINRAALDIIQRTKAMRTAKSLTAWLQKHPGDHPDEDLLNILGTALFIADQHTTGKSKLEQFAEIYQKENERLEQTRPGEKRWGVEWLPEREVDKKMAEREKALADYSQYSHQAAAALTEWQTLQGYYNTFTANGVRKASLAQGAGGGARIQRLFEYGGGCEKENPGFDLADGSGARASAAAAGDDGRRGGSADARVGWR